MDINIRRAVMQNLNNSSFDDVRKTVVDAMSVTEEKILPGLGVLFEVFWKNSSEAEQNSIIEKITKSVN